METTMMATKMFSVSCIVMDVDLRSITCQDCKE